jgi:C-terminal processing protease CtpA/Prc
MRLTTAMFGTGIFADKPEHEAFKIIDVLPQSAAERAGLRRGDRIVEAGGHPARDLSLSDFRSLDSIPARKELAVETDDGRRFTLAITQILP